MSRADTVRRRAADERGVIMILWALILVGLLTMVAIVVDLGHLRQTKARAQSNTDLAALAAGEKMASLHGPDPILACEDAVSYLRMNTPDLPAGTSVPCGDIVAACDASSTPVTVTDGGTAAPYEVAISYPVSDAMIEDRRVSGGLRPADGDQCERLSVSLERTNQGFFSGIVGVDSLSISAAAVVRRQPPESHRIPNLWLLDPTGCNLLTVQGGSSLTVGTAERSGLITLDSDGSTCQNTNQYTIDAGGSGSRIRVIPSYLDPPGEISLVAMRPGQDNCSEGNLYACDPADFVGDETTRRIDPMPTRRGVRATRSIVDHRFNCRSGQPSPQYPEYPAQTAPVKINIRDCTDDGAQPFIDQLRSGLGTSGQPSGFQRWRDHYTCNNPSVPPELPGNWWINCPTLKVSGNSLNFTGGNIVFDGDLDMTNGELKVNSNDPAPATPSSLPAECHTTMVSCLDDSSPEAAYVYFRPGGDIKLTGGVLNISRAAVIQHSGTVSITAGTPPTWSSPTEGPLQSLSLWSEAIGSYQINGGAQMDLEGVFFTPEANFTLGGNADSGAQNAQFISFHLSIAGGGSISLEPDGVNHLLLPPPVAALIR